MVANCSCLAYHSCTLSWSSVLFDIYPKVVPPTHTPSLELSQLQHEVTDTKCDLSELSRQNLESTLAISTQSSAVSPPRPSFFLTLLCRQTSIDRMETRRIDPLKLRHVHDHLRYLNVDGEPVLLPEKAYKNTSWRECTLLVGCAVLFATASPPVASRVVNSTGAKSIRILSEFMEPAQRFECTLHVASLVTDFFHRQPIVPVAQLAGCGTRSSSLEARERAATTSTPAPSREPRRSSLTPRQSPRSERGCNRPSFASTRAGGCATCTTRRAPDDYLVASVLWPCTPP